MAMSTEGTCILQYDAIATISQTCCVSTAPNGSTKSDRQREAAVEEVSNLTEIGCIAALLAGLEDADLFTTCWKPQRDIFARFSLSLGPSRPSHHYPPGQYPPAKAD